MKPSLCIQLLATMLFAAGASPARADITAQYVQANLSDPQPQAAFWKSQPVESVTLMAQPMVAPRPKVTTTENVLVQAVHNGSWASFRLSWKDSERSDGGITGTYSDGVAIQFPVNVSEPPMVFMGAPGSPVHIIHWRGQYQADRERGLRTMNDFYPNMAIDIYPLEFADSGFINPVSQEQRDSFAGGRGAGNPQSAPKLRAVDEILAEGFGSSAVLEGTQAIAQAIWAKGMWTVVISRPLARKNASALEPGKTSSIAFAVWQGGKDEVGSRKSVTMQWTPLALSPGPAIAHGKDQK